MKCIPKKKDELSEDNMRKAWNYVEHKDKSVQQPVNAIAQFVFIKCHHLNLSSATICSLKFFQYEIILLIAKLLNFAYFKESRK